MSGAPGLLLLRRYHWAVLGSNMPMVVVPSPSQSPVRGFQSLPPKANGGTVGAPGLLLPRISQVPLAGSNTAAVLGARTVPGACMTAASTSIGLMAATGWPGTAVPLAR